MKHVILSALALSALSLGCGVEHEASLSHGTTSSGGLLAPSLILECRPTEVADAGYELNAVLRTGGRAEVRLSKISFFGTNEISETFASTYKVVEAEQGNEWRLRHADFTLDLVLGELSDLPVNERVYGQLAIITERFEWGPNDLKVSCLAKAEAAPSPDLRAIRLSMFGMGPAVDQRAFAEMKQLIGALIADGTLGKYIHEGSGFEGGEQSCIELHRFVKSSALDELLSKFKAITPNPQTTSYEVTATSECALSPGV